MELELYTAVHMELELIGWVSCWSGWCRDGIFEVMCLALMPLNQNLTVAGRTCQLRCRVDSDDCKTGCYSASASTEVSCSKGIVAISEFECIPWDCKLPFATHPYVKGTCKEGMKCAQPQRAPDDYPFSHCLLLLLFGAQMPSGKICLDTDRLVNVNVPKATL